MHNYVILSMTATIVMMRAAMEQKKLFMNVRRCVRKNVRRHFTCQKECQKLCQKECQKHVRKNVRRYVRKNVKRYIRKNVRFHAAVMKHIQNILKAERTLDE